MKYFIDNSPDKDYFDILWKEIIEPCIVRYSDQYVITVDYNAKEEIWDSYYYFNTRCKTYMLNPKGNIDRHKVAACYMYAILSAKVISCQYEKPSADDIQLRVNEHLAIATGLSVLRAMIYRDLDDTRCMLDEEQKNKVRDQLYNGFAFPQCNHGKYEDNFAASLYFTRKEHTYNILSLADRLYFLEVYNIGFDSLLRLS